VNFCPPIEASNIAPLFGWTKTATPFSYLDAAPTPDLTITADALAVKASWLFLKRSIASLVWKAISSEKAWPPIWAPTLAWVRSA